MSFFKFLWANAPFLFAGFMLALLSSFGQTFFIAVFAGEIRSEFSLSHGEWGGIFGLATAVSAGLMLWAGGLTDRFRVRTLGAVVLMGLALACLGMAANPLLALLPVVIFALRFLGQGMTSHISGVAMVRWFAGSRGRALAVAALGFSVGEALLPIGFVALKAVMSWRLLWVIAAGAVVVSMPLLLILLRRERTPQSMAHEAQSLGMGGRHWTRGNVLRHRLFWFLMPALLGPSAFNTAFFFQQVHLTEVKGWPHAGLVALFPIYSAATVVAMLGSGWAVDRWGTARLMPLYQLPLAAFYFLFAGVDSLAMAMPIMVLLGMTSGAQSTVPVAFWAEFYGTRHIGAIKATAAAIMVMGSAIGPGLTGALIDAGIGFPQQMWGISAYILISCALVAFGIARSRRDLAMAPKIDVIRP
ncbi:MAG: MFS transporter [Paracoccaceae bacterium]|nr:MFS transporter [Paracoccaceae bacterium]